MKKSAIIAIALGLAPTPVGAQMLESKITASNGVVVDLSKDDFAGRAEYGGQMHKFSGTTSQNGAFLVAKTVRAKVTPRLSVQGFVNYRGEWHYYDTAILKGGETVELANIKRDVLSCRYGCSYSESFIIFPTKELFVVRTFGTTRGVD